MTATSSGTRRRRGIAIRAYVGANGAGKTLLAVTDLVPSLRAGRPVVSAVRLLDGDARPGAECVHPGCDAPDHGQEGHRPAHPAWVPLRRLSDLLAVDDCDVLLDEVGALVSARQSATLPFQIEAMLQQLRKDDLTLSWTAPAWARADKVLREVTQAATLCKGYGSRRVEGRLWRSRSLIRAKTYDARDLDDFEAQRVANPDARFKPRTLVGEWGRVARLGGAWYDTFERVPALGFAADSGVCVDCGGRRAPKKCSCI